MMSCEYAGAPFSEPRSHPWTDVAGNSKARYYDLTAAPELIRSALEDFSPWDRYSAVGDFYSLLENLNRSSSVLESNDCAFNGPHANENAQFAKALQCSGRVMVLYRALALNTSKERVTWLRTALHYQLARLDPSFRWGVIGTTLVPVRYLALKDHGQLGQQLMISFWAFGDSEADTMQNLARLLKNLALALRSVSAPVAAA